jgi:SHS2 domain-containing protein
VGKFRFLEGVAIADIAFEAYGNTLEEMFESSAQAIFEAMVDLETVEEKEPEKIRLDSERIEDLLFDWLSELVYLKDAQSFLFKGFEVQIKQNSGYRLEAVAKGEKIDPAKHHLRVDVKAVTYHMLEVKRMENQWKAQVILDI